MTRPAWSVVVPAYDEGEHVVETLHAVVSALDREGVGFEVLLVDDGSRDDTAALAERAARDDPRLRVLRHAENRGKGAALATGSAAARGDVLVFLDADLEISPDQVAPLVRILQAQGADVAVASKYRPGSRVRRPLHRVLLSRLYEAVTSVLFRMPLRDTQTGLKALRADLARRIVPAIRTRRWAWDVEMLWLAHRGGAGIAQGPVDVSFRARGTRIGWRGFLSSGLDTLLVFWRDRALAAYAPVLSRAPRGPRPPAAFVWSADDLGMSAGVDAGVIEALEAGHVTSASLLVDGPTAAAAAAAVRERAPGADVGVHLDLAPGRLAPFLAKGGLGLLSGRRLRAEVARQVETARAMGLRPTHVDAHRHAFLVPQVQRAVAAQARACGIHAMRRPVPLCALRCGGGLAGRVKGLLLLAASWATRGVPRAYGLAAPDGIADLEVAAALAARAGAMRPLRGRVVEVVCHPARGDDVPARERGVDRVRQAALLSSPPLREALEALGARTLRFADLCGG